MALTDKDPHNAREMAQAIVLAARIVHRQSRGKSTARLENKADRIREKAQEREDARARRWGGR